MAKFKQRFDVCLKRAEDRREHLSDFRRFWKMYLISEHFEYEVGVLPLRQQNYEGWNFNSDNYLFTIDTK